VAPWRAALPGLWGPRKAPKRRQSQEVWNGAMAGCRRMHSFRATLSEPLGALTHTAGRRYSRRRAHVMVPEGVVCL
jgi:hypothetical protein